MYTDNANIIRRITSFENSYRRMAENALRNEGVYQSHHHLLGYIAQHENTSQCSIAEALDISPAAVTNGIKRLELRGYVVKVVNSDDNRYNQVAVTRSGAKVHEDSERIILKIHDQIFQGFAPEERELLSKFIERMQQNITTVNESKTR